MEVYERVRRFNRMFGNSASGLFSHGFEQLKLIDEELNTEMSDAVRDGDFTMLRDALADVEVTVLGLAHRMGFNLEGVKRSLFEKRVPGCEQEALRSMQSHYADLQEWLLQEDCKALETEIVDMLGALYFYVGALGIPEDDIFAVLDSNDSKFCQSREEADKTAAKYLSEGVSTSLRETIEPGVFAVVRYPDGKLLKSVNYKPPVFTPIKSVA